MTKNQFQSRIKPILESVWDRAQGFDKGYVDKDFINTNTDIIVSIASEAIFDLVTLLAKKLKE